MRVLVATTAGTGHFGPLVPVARACVASGHDVAVAAPASFADQVATAGLAHLPFADAPAARLGEVFARVPSLSFEQANEVVVREVFGRLDAQAALPGCVESIDAWRPDVVVREPCELGSLAGALAADVPHVTVAIGLRATTDYLRPLLEAPLAELDALAGLPAGATAAAMWSAPTLTTVPSVLDDAVGAAPRDAAATHRFQDGSVPTTGPAFEPSWGDPSAPFVYVSFGSVTAGVPGFGAVYADVVAALADAPLRVLVTTGDGLDPATLGPLPAGIRVERWRRQTEVMPSCAAVVGHGGFGTTMTAAVAGVPQVVVPLFAYDQLVNGRHLQAVGAGLLVEGGPVAMADVPAAVARVVTERSFGQAARDVAEAAALLPPVSYAVEVVERAAS